MRTLALVNARGGSKGVPRKNVRPLAGRPLIAWSIEAGLGAARVTSLVVSTDDAEIAEVARASGARVPFTRPADLATDTAIQIDVVRHAVAALEAAGERYDAIVILQPTCPLRRAEDIDGALALLEESGADSVISVCDVGGRHPLTCYRADAAGRLSPLLPSDTRGVLRQQFGQVLWRNGAVYAMRRDVVMNRGSLYGDVTLGYIMPEERSFNIDSLFDWRLTEAYLRLLEEDCAGAS
ncbi:acylneuraminate cytidylyltransferase family protein [Salinarimonas sp.]|uniref:acylneuraminate cytidylyltransferase family protein n=1 Tax=Salinarimonas sp. TaxID=2766526 RepID=UPI0032D8C639